MSRSSAILQRVVTAVVAAGMLLSAGAQAAEPMPPYIEVTGEAEVKQAPDMALLDFGVSTRADNAAAAAQQNATQMRTVLDAVRKALGPGAQIGTGAYSLRAEHSTPRDGTPPRVIGYTATNTVRLETAELARIGELIDVATRAGANNVQRIAFTLKDPAAAQQRALRDAVLDGQAQAESIAKALGTPLGPVQAAIEQESGPVRPYMHDAVMARAEAATPIEPGTVAVRARVLLRYQLAR